MTDIQTCQAHGLHYDADQAPGCVKCKQAEARPGKRRRFALIATAVLLGLATGLLLISQRQSASVNPSTLAEGDQAGQSPSAAGAEAQPIQARIDSLKQQMADAGEQKLRLPLDIGQARGLENELLTAIASTQNLIESRRGAMQGFPDEMKSAKFQPGADVARWAEFSYETLDQAHALLDALTPAEDLARQPEFLRHGFQNLRRGLHGLAQPPGLKLQVPEGADPKRPAVSYLPGREARDAWLDTAKFQLDLTVNALARDRE